MVLSSFLIANDIAVFTRIKGDIYSTVDSLQVNYKVGDSISNNTTISSGNNSYALIFYKFTNGSLRVFPNSSINISAIDSLNTKITLNSGKILNDLKDKIAGSYTVETNSTVASVRGTAFEVSLTEEGTDVSVVEGNVDVLNKISGKTHSLGANQRLISRNDGEILEITDQPKPETEKSPEDNQEKEDLGANPNNGLDAPNLTILTPPDPTSALAISDPTMVIPISKTKADEIDSAISNKENAESSVENTDETSSNSIPLAVVLKIKGKLTLERQGKELVCEVGTLLENMDKVSTDANSLALIKLVDNSSNIRVFSNSEVVISAEEDNETLNKDLQLKGGSILSTVNNKIAGKYSVSTTSTIASVRGTEFLVQLENGITKVVGFSGRVEVENKKTKEKSLVTKGNTVTSTEDGQIQRFETQEVPAEVNDELESTDYENTMRINFENEDGSIKTIILEY